MPAMPKQQKVRRFLIPTLTKQSWLFMIGSALFAVGTALVIWNIADIEITNLLCFFGAWFFTTAGLFQTILSGDPTVQMPNSPVKMFRAEWLAAITQNLGTVLFNVSTAAALTATTVRAQERYVWNPDAGGSVAFVVSAAFVLIDYKHQNRAWEPTKPGWWSAQINMMGCIAFGLSAVGAFIEPGGAVADAGLANWGTFIGAICFFLASLIALPQLPWNRAEAVTATPPKTPQQVF